MNNINPSWLALLTGLPGLGLWALNRFRRVSAVLIAVAAAFLALGVHEWTGTLASLTATTTGLIKLLAVLVLSLILFFFEVVHTPKTKTRDGNLIPQSKIRRHYHRVRTMVTSAAFGTAVIVAKMRSADLSKVTKATPALAKQGLNTTTQWVNSGQAAASVSAHQQQIVWAAVAGIVIVLVILMVQVEKKVGRMRRRPKSSGGVLAKLRGGGKQVGGGPGRTAIGG